MRHRKDVPAPPGWQDPPAGERIDLQVRVITPLFGGGYEGREVDPECVIRPAAIRGHLRFWWRATVGTRYRTSQELFEAEEALWGSARVPGRAAVTARLTQKGKPMKCARFERGRDDRYRSVPTFERGWPAYALQAFQGELSRDRQTVIAEPSTAWVGVEFDIAVGVHGEELAEDVRAGVAAWVRYGGLGARTRRGCGSLSCDTLSSPRLQRWPIEADVRLTHLHGAVAVWGPESRDATGAWDAAVRCYRDFRQKEGFARNEGAEPNRPGRSRWPEPDAIRRLTGSAAPAHRPSHSVERGFPRAELGLPIIFHFKDLGDPPDATLHGHAEGLDRFASPVVTKAVAEGDHFRPLVLVLAAPAVCDLGDLRLDVGSRTTRIPRREVELTSNERAAVLPLGGQATRAALVAYLESQGWKREVLP